jgi:hypothetical protein
MSFVVCLLRDQTPESGPGIGSGVVFGFVVEGVVWFVEEVVKVEVLGPWVIVVEKVIGVGVRFGVVWVVVSGLVVVAQVGWKRQPISSGVGVPMDGVELLFSFSSMVCDGCLVCKRRKVLYI